LVSSGTEGAVGGTSLCIVDLDELVQAGYEWLELLSATAPSRDERKAIEALLSHRCEALILLGPRDNGLDLRELSQRAVVAVVGRRAPGAHVDSVHTAETKGMRQAVDHLVERGHHEIVHIDGGKGPGSAKRRRAYRTAMRAHRLAEHARVITGAHTEEAGVEAARLLLDEEHSPTAVLAGNDRCALGLIRTLMQASVDVPRDVSVVGYDDSHISHLTYVDLTTIRQDADRMAEHAVQQVVSRLDNTALPPNEIVLDPKLVVRGTTAPPPTS
jgi:DNA-binding LacI/PurR family transcriptional regulator